ncbi:uncharacterized protein LOC133038146 [Cannabis sativa]|uniref:uncharacterized protein LOC133038146 n=1 Tax=Cannabis sativa TaxID=3483 RepID=UPI0029CA510C|nr:uncharacterized protein LOC133038146 [Cannabis sativa]
MKTVLHSIISQNQCAFLSDRLIFDNIFIANEIINAIHYRKAGKQGWATIKLDMEKAFDKVEWSFVKAMLHHRYKTNLLSSYLFLLVVEGLSATIRAKEKIHQFTALNICKDAPIISHLFFVDDSILFTPVTTASSAAIKDMLFSYHKGTGQTINLAKSSIMFSPNTPHDSQDLFRTSLGLGNEGFISKYLGVPHCTSRSSNSHFNYLVQKVASKLNIWDGNFFSRAGKKTLIKAMVHAIPSYAMSCFKLPNSTYLTIQKAISKF